MSDFSDVDSLEGLSLLTNVFGWNRERCIVNFLVDHTN